MIYYIIYWMNGSANIGGPYVTQDQATTAYNWFQSLDGCTYVEIQSVETTSVQTWGTPPTA